MSGPVLAFSSMENRFMPSIHIKKPSWPHRNPVRVIQLAPCTSFKMGLDNGGLLGLKFRILPTFSSAKNCDSFLFLSCF